MSELDRCLTELRRAAGFEDLAGAVEAARSAAQLEGEDPPRALVALLRTLDAVDLSDDAGDVADELWRTSSALEAGLEACGARAIAHLRPVLDWPQPDARSSRVALRVLARLGDASVLPLAERWASDDGLDLGARTTALEAIGALRPPNASALVRAALAKPGELNTGHLKSAAARAFARVGDVAALEVLLDDADWYARLGVVEALELVPREHARAALRRAKADVDARVSAAAARALA